MDLISYILSKKYADKLFAGGGAAKGKNCTIQSIEEIEGGNRVTFQWTLDDGTVQTDTLDVMNGAPGEQGPKGDKGDQGETGPAGADGKDGQDGVNGQDGRDGIDGQDGTPGADGKDGADGVGIVSIEKTQTVGLVDIYTITFTNGETSSFNVTNGASGASTAEDVEYDNSNTQLEATNIQDAIDEIANGSSSKPNIKATYEESPTTAAHSVDDYIYYDSHLYKVIAAIVIGDTLVVDTNIELASEVEEGTEVFIENLPGGSGSGSGGDSALTTDVVTNTTVGAIPSGTTLTEGTTFTEFVQALTIAEVAPTVSFSISKSGNVEYGESYTETLTVNVSNMGSAKKINTIAWYEGSTLIATDTIDSTVSGSWTHTMDTATTDTTTFKAVVSYKKSDNTDTSTTKTASINFYYNKFYGSVASLTPTEATVEALTSTLATAKGGTYKFTTSAARIAYAYPSSLGALTSIKDGNGFSLFDSFTRTTETYTQNGTSVSYYLYVLTDATTVTNYNVTFA